MTKNDGYAAEPDASTFLENNHNPLRADLINMMGARMAFVSEPARGKQFDAENLKKISGNDYITARGPYMKSMVTFRPTFKLFVLSNHIPAINADDESMVKRLRIVQYRYSFKETPTSPMERTIDKDIERKLNRESGAILNRLLAALQRYLKAGKLATPKCVDISVGK